MCFIAKAQSPSFYFNTNKLDSSDLKPEFTGGNDGFTKYIINNQQSISSYDPSGYATTALCTIEKDGTISHIKIKTRNSDCADCDSEVIRLLKLSPKWKPGIHNGKPTKMKMSLVIKLRVNEALRGEPAALHESLKKTKFIYPAPEKAPEYPDGIDNFTLFVKSKMNTPPDFFNVQGNVFVTFVIEKNGKLTHINVLRSPHPTLSEEVIKAVRKSPKWMPGMIRDTAVRTQYTVRIGFP